VPAEPDDRRRETQPGGFDDNRPGHPDHPTMTRPDADANPLRAFFDRHQGATIDKWLHYLDIYHRHFARFRERPVTVVEIGVFQGGSLAMWRDYFGPQARIVGIDIDERCRDLAPEGTEVRIGSQTDREFLRALKRELGTIDVLIDDGGHEMVQQLVSFDELFPAVSAEGVYLVEDLHTSYWPEYGGGLRQQGSFIEFAKSLIDHLNAWHSRDPGLSPGPWTRAIDGLHFYDSVLVVEKRPRLRPIQQRSGRPPRFVMHQTGAAP
jgi:hypothetical protein